VDPWLWDFIEIYEISMLYFYAQGPHNLALSMHKGPRGALAPGPSHLPDLTSPLDFMDVYEISVFVPETGKKEVSLFCASAVSRPFVSMRRAGDM